MDHYTCADPALEIYAKYAILPDTRPLNHALRAISYLDTCCDTSAKISSHDDVYTFGISWLQNLIYIY